MFSKPEMVRKELYCTNSIISKFAVHRHFNSPLRQRKQPIARTVSASKEPLSSAGENLLLVDTGPELSSAMKMNL